MMDTDAHATRWLIPLVLGVAGAGLAVGGFLHPHVPIEEASVMGAVATSGIWAPAHWGITLVQALGVLGVALVAGHIRAQQSLATVMLAGLVLVAVGFLLGTLGTLSAATGLKAAAQSGDVPLFEVVDRLTLGIGWLCVVVTATGGILVGSQAVQLARSTSVTAFGWTMLGGSAAFLSAAAFLPPTHPWTHEYLLRLAAVGSGLLLVAAASGWARAAARGATRAHPPPRT